MSIDTEIQDGVLLVTNNDPATRNAIGLDAFDGLAEAVEQATNNPDIGAVVVTGAGGFFCSGGDINGLRQRVGAEPAARREGIDKLHAMIQIFRNCPKPVIAAIEGGAAGAGVSLALACDLIVAARDAYFSVAYVKIGLTPDGGATSFLSQSLPRQLVAELCMTGDRVGVERLHQFGVINRLTEPGEALPTALAAAKQLSRGPARSISRIKELTFLGQANTLDEQLECEAERMSASLGDDEAAEGTRAFLEKRPPDFVGLRSKDVS